MRFLRLAWQNLLRHRIRSLLTVLGIAASVAALFSIVSFNRGFTVGLDRELARSGLHFMVVPSGCPHEVASLVLHGAVIPKFLDLKVLGKIRSQAEVEIASPLLVTQLANPEKKRVDLVYGMEMDQAGKIKPGWVITGRLPAAPGEVLVGAAVAEHDRTRPGDLLRYPAGVFTVAGVLAKTGSQDDAFIYMPLATLQKMLKKTDSATAIGVRVLEPERVAALADRLAAELPGIQIVTMGQVVSSLSTLAASAKALSLSIAAIAVLISTVGVMNSILMAIFERTSELGMMRAMGASRADIFRIILKETVLLTLTGGVAGILLSLAGAGVIENAVRGFMPYVPPGDMIRFDPLLAAACIGFSVVLGLAAGAYPAWRASKINPIEAIKG